MTRDQMVAWLILEGWIWHPESEEYYSAASHPEQGPYVWRRAVGYMGVVRCDGSINERHRPAPWDGCDHSEAFYSCIQSDCSEDNHERPD